LDVFHSLHCLYRIQQALHPEKYQEMITPNESLNTHPNPPWHDHIDHCFDHIRQSLQCHSDLTPMEWERKSDKLILRTETPHTCRDFGKIWKWAAAHMSTYPGLEDEALTIVD
ncbi:hypothetical protein J3E72DRAFT_182111, partial [Bipolaris maydis]